MTPAYMPFTYLSPSTICLLTGLVGPIVVYQPSKKNIPEGLSDSASQGLVELRMPMTDEDDRVCAALAEFTDWVRLNPGSATPGAGFYSARQGEVPFFDETTINRIRSDIKHFQSTDLHRVDAQEAGFSARLFLAVAQENDLAADLLDHDLNRFKALEKDFLDTLKDADDATFKRDAYGGTLWQEDPGAKLTGQRIRAWSNLAAADAAPPELLVTTSRSVMDTLVDTYGDAIGLERLADIGLAVPPDASAPVLGSVLADLAAQETLSSEALAPFSAMSCNAVDDSAVTVTLLGAVNHPPAAVISRLASPLAAPPEENGKLKPLRHTLFLLVES